MGSNASTIYLGSVVVVFERFLADRAAQPAFRFPSSRAGLKPHKMSQLNPSEHLVLVDRKLDNDSLSFVVVGEEEFLPEHHCR